MARAPYVRRKERLGFAYRFAVAILFPIFTVSVKWDIRGTEKLTDDPGGVIVAPNHMSWFDPIVVCYLLWTSDRPPRFLAKDSLFRVKVIGPIIKGAGQIPVHRGTADAASAIKDALVALDEGECVVVYPEGTVTRDPDLWPMKGKSGAVRLALASGKPLYPVAQWGAQQVMRPYTKEFRLFPRKTIRVLVGEPVDLSDFAGRPLDARTLSEATARLMAAITALLADLRGEEPPPVAPEEPAEEHAP
jgi:1-acyl-sn-glycerol-3-phosphate acyltransferase